MSELVNTFPFPGMGADGGLDIGAIFGEISAGGDTNPFDPPPAASPLETASNTSEEPAARTQPQPSQAADIVPEPTPAPAAPAGPTQEELLTQIRDLLKEQNRK